MKCIINSVMTYNSDDGTLLSHDNTIDIVTLNRITNELLLLFINNNNTPLRRDTILHELWEKRGLSSSSNNLNNYVSILRKSLMQCGCFDIITTIPKHGFLFEAKTIIFSDKKLVAD